MAGSCIAMPEQGLLASQVIGFLDCQALTLGEEGYRALAAPGSAVGVTLPGLLTLFVAAVGFRMLLGETPSLRDGVLILAKLGLVLTLASSWPAYRTLVYDVALRAPAELAGAVGTGAGLPGAGGGLLARLDGVDRSVEIILAQAVAPGTPSKLNAGDLQNLRGARTLFLSSAIAVFGFTRLAAGLLLALGPLFAALALFEATRGLTTGWVRGLVGTLLTAFAGALVFGVELALIEPWLARIAVGGADPGLGGQVALLLSVVSTFAVALGAVAILMLGVAAAFRLPTVLRYPWPAAMGGRTERGAGDDAAAPIARSSRLDPPRARRVAEALAADQRREFGVATGGGPGSARLAAEQAGSPNTAARAGLAGRSGRAHRVSASAQRRDGAA